MRLEGRRAFVTGGGRGIGRAIALKFAEAGADVAVAARTSSEIDAVAGEIQETGRRSLAIPCDVGDSKAVDEAVQQTSRELGGVDVLVANAGALVHAPLGETTDALWDEMMRVNLNGAFYAFRAAIGGMSERGWGRLIAISSVSGKIGGPNRSAYHAAKHGVLGLVRSVALEAAAAGVTVNAICPGFVETGMVATFREGLAEQTEGGESAEEAMNRYRDEVPMGRFLAPEEIAAMALYLASEEAGGITGQAYTISCGAIQI
ncbi:MAG: SDR family NAD(P)-dependent oxidoreductase [Nitrospinae bacterium]|nr:SDR family NAD(P)-dependent oxidoreductase [Nitrospinota bacterium]